VSAAEPAPALPPPMNIGPAPGATKSSRLPRPPGAATAQNPQAQSANPPPAAPRSALDTFFGIQRWYQRCAALSRVSAARPPDPPASARKCSSTNNLIADERLPWRRSTSIDATNSDSVMLRDAAISFRPLQNASSRLTLVLCPAMTIDRLTTGDFIDRPRFRCRFCAHREAAVSFRSAPSPRFVPLWCGHESCGWLRSAPRPAVSLPPCGLCADWRFRPLRASTDRECLNYCGREPGARAAKPPRRCLSLAHAGESLAASRWYFLSSRKEKQTVSTHLLDQNIVHGAPRRQYLTCYAMLILRSQRILFSKLVNSSNFVDLYQTKNGTLAARMKMFPRTET